MSVAGAQVDLCDVPRYRDAHRGSGHLPQALGLLVTLHKPEKLQVDVNEPGRLLGGVLLVFLLAPFPYALFHHATLSGSPSALGRVTVGIYGIFIGLVFLASYYFSYKSFLLRGFLWFCEHGSFPATRKMAFFYFALCCLMGILSISDGLAS